MFRLINSLPFFYSICAIFVILGAFIKDVGVVKNIPVLFIVWWIIYFSGHFYLYLAHKIKPTIPPFIIVFAFISGGISSPVTPLIFLALPYVYTYFKNHYIIFAILSLIMLISSGNIHNSSHFILYILYFFAATAVYVFGDKDKIARLFAGKSIPFSNNKKDINENEEFAVSDPFVPLKIYIQRTVLCNKQIPVSIKLIKIDGEKGQIFDSDKIFPLTGLLRICVTDKQEIACAHVLEEKEHLPMMPDFNRRIYFPVNLFGEKTRMVEPEFVVVIDAFFEGDKNLLVEILTPIKKDVVELLKVGDTFSKIFSEKQRKQKIYKGAEIILNSISKDSLFISTAYTLFNVISETEAVFVAEKLDEQIVAYVFEKESDGVLFTIENIKLTVSAEIKDEESISAMILDKKLGTFVSYEDLRKRENKIFNEPELRKLNNFSQMHAVLLEKNNVSKGVVAIFLSNPESISLQSREDFKLITSITASALENIEMYEKVKEMSNTDSLSTLYNRRYFQDHIERMVLEASRSNIPLALIMIDVDFFKKINDKYGHKAGDDVIRFMGRTLKNNIRKVDIACRYGGEEFVILLHNTDSDGAFNVAEKLRTIIQEAFIMADKKQFNITASFGVSAFPNIATNAEALLKTADAALYYSKNNGRNRVTIFDNSKQ